MTVTTEKIAETKRNIAETEKKIKTSETFTMKEFVQVLENIDEIRTTTLTAQYDAINVFEAKQHDASNDFEDKLAECVEDIVNILDKNMTSLKNAIQEAFDELTGGRVNIATEVDEEESEG